MDYDKEPPFEISRYREMQNALPGVDALYRLMLAQLQTSLPDGGEILVVGAGGGREVELLCGGDIPFRITGVDPSQDMLDMARWYADQTGQSGKVTLVRGTTSDIEPPNGGFDAATSLLVMHFLPDDDQEHGKARYLQAIRERMKPGACFIHADICFDNPDEFEAIKPVFLRHALLAGLEEAAIEKGPDMIASLPIITASRTEQLLQQSGFSEPRTLFQSLWYRAWTAHAK